MLASRRWMVGLLLTAWPLLAGAQLVIRDSQGPAGPNPADSVKYPDLRYAPCDDTIADYGAKAVLQAVDQCPLSFYASRQAYFSYAKQAVLAFSIPGAPEAAGAMAIEKAAENLFFCISDALIDSSDAPARDKDYAKALLKATKEYADRVDFARKAAELGRELANRNIAPYLKSAHGNTFFQTLDAAFKERLDGAFGGYNIDGQYEPGVDVGLAQAAAERHGPQAAAQAADEQALALARDCRFAEAEAAYATAQQYQLEHLASLRRNVAKAEHHRKCLVQADSAGRRTMADSSSPYLRHSLDLADADIAERKRIDAEYTRLIALTEDSLRAARARQDEVAFLREKASRQLQSARQAIGECSFERATRLLDEVGGQTLECALELDAIRLERDALGDQMRQLREQLPQLDAEYTKALSTPLAEVAICGQYGLFADELDKLQGQCRTLIGIDTKVANLRERGRACADFKAAQAVQAVAGEPPLPRLPSDPPAAPVSGTFGPPRLVLGNYPPRFEDHEKKLYGEMGPRTATTTAEWVPASAGKTSITHTYSGNLPDTLRPGDIIELSCQSQGSTSGQNPPNWGSSCAWTVEGSVQVLTETRGAFAGIGSDGKLYPSSTATLTFKVGSGGRIIVRATQVGFTWGAGGQGHPSEYFYEFVP